MPDLLTIIAMLLAAVIAALGSTYGARIGVRMDVTRRSRIDSMNIIVPDVLGRARETQAAISVWGWDLDDYDTPPSSLGEQIREAYDRLYRSAVAAGPADWEHVSRIAGCVQEARGFLNEAHHTAEQDAHGRWRMRTHPLDQAMSSSKAVEEEVLTYQDWIERRLLRISKFERWWSGERRCKSRRRVLK